MTYLLLENFLFFSNPCQSPHDLVARDPVLGVQIFAAIVPQGLQGARKTTRASKTSRAQNSCSQIEDLKVRIGHPHLCSQLQLRTPVGHPERSKALAQQKPTLELGVRLYRQGIHPSTRYVALQSESFSPVFDSNLVQMHFTSNQTYSKFF